MQMLWILTMMQSNIFITMLDSQSTSKHLMEGDCISKYKSTPKQVSKKNSELITSSKYVSAKKLQQTERIILDKLFSPIHIIYTWWS